jgi:beta-lactamase regulating signal transducer with metallopeptidase domain
MNAPLQFDTAHLWHIAGWTMVHYLWIGAIAAVAALLLRWLLRSASPNSRYVSALACLLLLATMPIGIAAWLATNSPPLQGGVRGGTVGVAVTPTTDVDEPENQIIELAELAPEKVAAEPTPKGGSERALPAQHEPSPVPSLKARGISLATLPQVVTYLPWLWIVGSPVTFVILAAGLVGTKRLRQASRAIDDSQITEMLKRVAASLRVRARVGIAVCDRIAAPVLIGILRPIVLLPPAAITGWSPDEIEMVLLHELAHVRRWDNLVNLLQRCVESLLFFHPAVWLVSSWVRREREACCDAIVVGRTLRPHAYAELLVALAAQMPRSVLFYPAASSAMAAGPLQKRIRRILQLDDDPMLVSGKSFVVVLSGVFLAATLALLYAPTIGQAEQPVDRATAESRSSDENKEMPADKSAPANESQASQKSEAAIDDAAAGWLKDIKFNSPKDRDIALRAWKELGVKIVPASDAELAFVRQGNMKGGLKLLDVEDKLNLKGPLIFTHFQMRRLSTGISSFDTLNGALDELVSRPAGQTVVLQGFAGGGSVFQYSLEWPLKNNAEVAVDRTSASDAPARWRREPQSDASEKTGAEAGSQILESYDVGPELFEDIEMWANIHRVKFQMDLERGRVLLQAPRAVHERLNHLLKATEVWRDDDAEAKRQQAPIRMYRDKGDDRLHWKTMGLILGPSREIIVRRRPVMGLEVAAVEPGSPADWFAIQPGDVVTQLASFDTPSLTELNSIIKTMIDGRSRTGHRIRIRKADGNSYDFDLPVKRPTNTPEVPTASEFPYTVRFQKGASRFLDGDQITVREIRGTSRAFEPGNIYRIKGTYTLASHDRAQLSAFTTAKEAKEGTGPVWKIQTTTVDRGTGTFELLFPMKVRGWPHLSFYPPGSAADSFGSIYFGTGDSVLQNGRDEDESANNARTTAAPAPRAARFPSLEDQKLVDLAYKRLQLELEPLGDDDLKRVQALGSEGGVKVTGSSASGGIRLDDILVGLHVWPTTSLNAVAEVLQRDDLAELSPLKFYIVRSEMTGGSPDQPIIGDVVETGRISVAAAALQPYVLPSPENEADPPKSSSNRRPRGRRPAPLSPDSAPKESLRYDGKTFGEWRTQWQNELSNAKRTEAVKALAAFARAGYGKEAVEIVLDVAGNYDFYDYAEDAEGILKKSVVKELLPDNGNHGLARYWAPDLASRLKRDPQKWGGLAYFLLTNVRSNDPEVQAVIRSLAVDAPADVRGAALGALVRSSFTQGRKLELDAQTRDLLREALESDDLMMVHAALQALQFPVSAGYVEPRTVIFLPELVPLLFHDDENIQLFARGCLQNIDSKDAPKVMDHLVNTLKDDAAKPDRRLAAIRALGAMGAIAESALASLKRVITPSADKSTLIATYVAMEAITKARHTRNYSSFGISEFSEELGEDSKKVVYGKMDTGSPKFEENISREKQAAVPQFMGGGGGFF